MPQQLEKNQALSATIAPRSTRRSLFPLEGRRVAQKILQAEVLANADYCKAGYGVLTEPEREAIHLLAKHEGLSLDPVYTGRAAARMIDLIRKAFFKK